MSSNYEGKDFWRGFHAKKRSDKKEKERRWMMFLSALMAVCMARLFEILFAQLP
jgi:hypothetical protein